MNGVSGSCAIASAQVPPLSTSPSSQTFTTMECGYVKPVRVWRSPMARATNASDDHAFVEKMAQAGIAETGTIPPFVSALDDGQLKQLDDVARGLLARNAIADTDSLAAVQ